jgi:YidC/Oxa1 family membrane protein insertase
MDKQSTIGFILIGLVLLVWMWVQAPPPPAAHAVAAADSVRRAQASVRDTVKSPVAPPPEAVATTPEGLLGSIFAPVSRGGEKIVVVVTDRYRVEITSKGALVKTWELVDFKTWDKEPVELVDYDRGGDLSLLFTSSEGKLINTRNLYFDIREAPGTVRTLGGDQSYVLECVLPLGEGRRLVKRFTFTNGTYSFDTEFQFSGLGQVISNFEYQIVWESGLRYAEHNSIDESSFAMAYASSGGELIEVDASKAGETARRDINGATDWVATRNKYFALALIPEKGVCQGAYLEGVHAGTPNNGAKETYTLALKMPLKTGNETAKITVYLGPLDFNLIKGFGRGLEQILSLGWSFIRPISEYVMIPLFQFLHMFIPNYGWVIVVFSIIIKIALHPLSRSQMKSMKRMQALTPLMTEIREKYKDDPNKQNQQIMNLYKEYGVNPAGGCLPLLVQMPILFALYAVFRSSIALRQSAFIFWIQDLSIPDSILHLGFTVPFFGITEVSGLAVAMGVTMFLQQKMTVTDPRQKAMVWMMPILMTLMFNSLPSGLNLYYFVFNLLAIGQQIWFNKSGGDEPLRKVDPKKKGGGILARIAKEVPKLK